MTPFRPSYNVPLRAGDHAPATPKAKQNHPSYLNPSRPNLSHANQNLVTGLLETTPAFPLCPSWLDHDAFDVNIDSAITTLPLRTLGLPGQWRQWLTDAGIPSRPLDRTVIRQGIANEPDQSAILLYNSQDASARIDAMAATSLGYEVIDAARLLAERRLPDHPDHTVLVASPPRTRWLDGLRGALEAAGGTWLRLADYPHPYRAAICESNGHHGVAPHGRLNPLFNALIEIPTTGQANGRLPLGDWLRAGQDAGRPMVTQRPINTLRGMTGTRAIIDPLTWVTTLETLTHWWKWRAELSLQAVCRSRTTELTLTLPDQIRPARPWQPAVEIWRGRHCAIVPINPGTITIDHDTLPFQTNTRRHRAGFLADFDETDFSREDWSAPAAAS